MRRTRLSIKKLKAFEEVLNNDDSSNDVDNIDNVTKPATSELDFKTDKCDLSESSSEGDIETNMKPTNELDLASSVFAPNRNPPASGSSFEAIEADIFGGINRLSESDSETENTQIPIGIQHFKDIELYNAKLNDAKKFIEKYEARKQAGPASIDINNLLAAGEKVILEMQKEYAVSSDYESYSGEEDWEEIKNEIKPENQENKNTIKDVEITVDMPGRIAKKKGFDLMASIKRRINRVKKEQQVYIHKVHLLCWIGHGNYVNKVLNQESIQAIALSLLPSQHCYPASRVDLSYLEQILTWYRKTIHIVKEKSCQPMTLEQSLQHQMYFKETSSNNVFVYIFICILRSLGINVRLVMNLMLEPIRPPSSELCSLSNKTSEPVDSKQESAVSSSKIENKNTQSVPTTNNTIPLISKLRKISNNSDDAINSSGILLKSADTKPSAKPSAALKSRCDSNQQLAAQSKCVAVTSRSAPKVNLKNLSKVKQNSNGPSSNDKDETKARNSKRRSISSVNEIEGELFTKEQSSMRKLKDSETMEKFIEIKKTEDTNLIKFPKESELKRSIKKRLSERSVNNFPASGVACNEGTSKKQSPNPHSSTEYTVIDLTAKRDLNNKSNKASTMTEAQSESKRPSMAKVINTKATSKSDGKNDMEDSKKKSSKRTLTSSTSTDRTNPRGGKKRKDSIKQMDGPNDSSDDSDYQSNDYYYSILTIPQLDGNDSSESEKNSKPNLRKLSTQSQSGKSGKSQAQGSYKKGTNESLKALQKSREKMPESTKSVFSSSQSSYFSSPDKKAKKQSVDVRDDIINLIKTNINQEKQKRTSRRQKKTNPVVVQTDSDSDSDFAPISCEKKKLRNDSLAPITKVKRRVLPRQELDKICDGENEKKKNGIDIWVEVFLEAEEKWISVDVLKGQVHCVQEIYSRASHPISYILSWDNNNYIKDVTQRYCTTNWNTVTRKLRVTPEWWSPALKPFEGPKNARQREEDEELEQQQIDQPLPKAISEYKNHPLYALKRHLLKFEGIYPADAPPLGFVRNEPVYSRMCVHTLHSREIWVKHAKVVKPGENAYKIVKARPKYDRYSNTFITDKPLEIFGIWQVDDYVPPTAEDGIVPKNAYGNVELFKKCMLPKGTVHLDLPGLQKVARKLSIDCPPAVVGFDFHGGWSHPTFEGFVVCEEFADILTTAWHQEQEEAEKRELERIDKRVYGNWRKLIKGLLIRERLQKRYDFAQPSTSGKKSKLVLKKNRLCSDSDSE